MEAEILDIMELKEALEAWRKARRSAIGGRSAAIEASRRRSQRRRRRPSTPLLPWSTPLSVRAIIISCHGDRDSKDLRRAGGVLVARRPHLARPKTQYVLAKDPELPPLPVLGRATALSAPGAGAAPLEGEDIFVSEEDPNAKQE